jgi:hypothetical protein
MNISKMIVAAIAVLAFSGALLLAQAGCTSDNLSTPTGCVAAYPDAGGGYQCAVEWSCDNSATYEIQCTLTGGNYACICSTNTSSLEAMVTLNPQVCDLGGASLVIANACGYMLEM